MTKTTSKTRALSLLLAVLMLLGVFPMNASAATIADGSSTATIGMVDRNYYLSTTAGTKLGASAYQYTTNDGLTGPAYCINHGLNLTSRALPITGKYNASPKTAGAFANGYPQHSLETFLGLYLANNSVLQGLTEKEYGYATQLAVWATLGQLAIEGTAFSSGRETVAQPSGDAQQMRVFRAVQLILDVANSWTKVYQSGMYIRLKEDELGGNISIPGDMTLEYAADNQQFGLKREVINGKSYFTREYIFATATSSYYSEYNLELWADNAPEGTIFVDTSNNELPRGTFLEHNTWRLHTENHDTSLNSNGFEYYGVAKMCVPVDTVPNSGEIKVNCGAFIMQYEIYLAKNDVNYEQSYIIADPSKGTLTANATLQWGGPQTEQGSLQVTKTSTGGLPLSGAKFTLTGTDGSSRIGVTDDNGIILWEQLDPKVTYTLTETEAPAGYSIVDPINIQIQAARTNYVTVQDSTQKQLTVKKVDKQTGYSLQGAVICFEQIDGSFKTMGTTDQAGIIQFDAEQLPVGSYKVYEVTAPVGYELDTTPQTVHWDGRRDVVITMNNVRTPTIIIYKCDEGNNRSLSGATFEVYRDGQLFTTVTTNDSGLAYVPNVTTGYYTVKETVAPAGYVLDSSEHSVYVDNYNPATTDDPRIAVSNKAMPMLRIVKYDGQTMQRLSGVTFAVYRDTELIGEYTTDANGEIFLYDLAPGTYLVKEIGTPDSHVVNSTPQEIKLDAGTADNTVVFLNYVKPGIHIVKLDAQTMKPLPNAKFRVTQVGGDFSNEFTSDASGEVDLSKLDPGSYVVEEITAPDGYLIDDAKRTIKIEAGESAAFVFTDTRKPSLTVVKYDAEKKLVLSGATFRIAKIEDGSHYLDRVTDTNGKIVIDNLEPGVYSVQEMTAPTGYVLNDMEYHVELFPGRESELVVTDEKKPDLKIIKTDAVTGKPIAGATFTIRKMDSSTLLTETTDAKGEIFLSEMDPGVYEVTEQSVPDAYLLDPRPQKITLFPNKLGVVQFQDYQKPTLTIKKIDSATGKPVEGARFHVIYASNHTFTGEVNDLGEYYSDANGLIKLDKLIDGWYQVTEVEAPAGYRIPDSGVQECYIAAGTDKVLTFENVPLSTILIQKMDEETGKPLSGAWFRMKFLNAMTSMDGTTIGEWPTDDKGQIEVNNLDEGTYVIAEISAPAGYVKSAAASRTVYLSGENQDFVTITYGNQKMGSLLIVKKDKLTGAPLSGVEFFVTDSDGAVVGNGNGKFTTDYAGSILINNLEPGKTIVAKETRTVSGYVLDDAPQTVKIKANETVTLEFRNAPKGTLIVQKIDSATGKPLPGAEFKITAANGELTADNEGLTSSNGIYTADRNGQVVLEKLTPGAYVVTETVAPEGYELTANPQTVVVNAGDTQTLTFGNPPKGTLIVQKYDKASGQPLSGAEFKIVTASGEFVAGNEGLTSSNGLYVTDQNGQIVLSKLNTAAYVVTETKAPEGYQLDPTPQTVVVNPNDTQTINFYDEPLATLTIIKRDVDTKELLPGAAFTVKDGAGNLIGDEKQYVTGTDGTVTLTGLAPNSTVVVSEETPPAGYWNGSDLQTTLLKSGTVNSVTFENRKLGTLIIRKFVEGTNNQPLKGVAFRVTSSDGTEIGPDGGVYYTDAKGEIVLKDLQPDITVKAREIKTIDGYILDGTPQDIKIVGGQTQQLTFWNAPEQTLTVQKYVEGTTTPIAGVIFLITDSSGAVLGENNGEFTTDRNGRIVLSGLKPGTTVTAKEVKTVSGYVLNSAPQSILIKAGESQTLTFYNQRKGGLIVKKLDSITGKALEGAEFRITTIDGKYVDDHEGQTSTKGIYRTDKNGEIFLSNLEPNTYVVKEIAAPEGYVLCDEEQSVQIGTNDTQTLTFMNIPKQNVVIQKFIDGTTKPLAGVTFLVTDGAGNPIGSANGQHVTDESGRIVLTGLTPGMTLLVREIKTVKGYELNGTPQAIVVGADSGSTATPSLTVLRSLNNANSARVLDASTITTGSGNIMTFYDEPLSTLIVHKYVEGTKNEPLSGVAFKITDGNGGAVGPTDGVYYTNSEGEIIITDLEQGSVITVQEVKTVEGYLLDGTPKQVKIKSSDVHELTFWNAPEQTLTVQKYVEGTTTPIAGVTFLITDSSGAVLGENNGEFTTDRNGRIVLSGLKPGTTVTAKEVKTVSGYVLNSTPQSILIKAGESQTLTFYNQRKGGLIVEKRDSVTDKPLAGAEFRITTIDGKFVDDHEGQTSTKGIYCTDSNGQIILTDLQPNSYVVRETKAPTGYVLDKEEQSVRVNANDTQTIVFKNTPLQSVTIQKLVEGSGKPLAGVTFLVTDANGAPVGSANGEHVTDANGRITINGLTPGMTIIAREVKTVKGYVLNSNPQTIVVGTAAGGQTVTAAPATATGGTTATGNSMTFYDEPLSVLVIQKYVEGTTIPIKGVRFHVTDNTGAAVGNTDGDHVTDENGQIVLKNLEPGTVITAREVKAADGYVTNSDPKSITIKSGDVQTLTFYNSPTGTLMIVKRDRATEKALAGAKFQITDASGAFIGNDGGKLTSNGEFTTDDKGQIIISGLQPGTLVIREIKAPDGYTLSEQPVTVKIEANDTQTINIYNDAKQTLTVQKFVTDTTRPIQGVTFLITDSSGQVIGPNNGEYTTDRNGRIVLSGLTPGTTITAKETKTVKGYVLDTTPQSILIKQGEAQTLTFYNSPEGGLELIKVNAYDKTKRIGNVTFEIRRMDGGLVETVTTGDHGRVHVNLDAGNYYAVEIEAAKGFKLDNTPHYFEIKDGETTTLTVANTPFSGIEIHKIDAVTREGIYGAKFLLYDAEKRPVGEYVTDQNGYIYIDDLTRDGKYFIRELECDGYNVDEQVKTINVKAGAIIQIEWENTPITGQIQITKYAAENNSVTGHAAGTALPGAVFEIVRERSGKVVGYITTDAHGVAASSPLPLGRYILREVTAPAYYQVSAEKFDVTLEYPGQIIKLSAYDKPAQLSVTILKTGVKEVLAGSRMTYNFTVANGSNVALENFFWHDKLPYDISSASGLTTGTYNTRLTYRILYKTNCNDYRVLASNLLSTNNYGFQLNALKLMDGEVVTDIYFDFGTVPAGFQSTTQPTLTVAVSPTATNGYYVTNRADAGGKYGGTWETNNTSWLTIVKNLTPVKNDPLPKTGY